MENVYKVVMAGDKAVGKTSIVTKYGGLELNEQYIDFVKSKENVGDKDVHLIVWDWSGPQRFMHVPSSFYRGATAVVLTYDITKKSTFEYVEKWMIDNKEYLEENVTLTLAGNKWDLEKEREVGYEEGQKFAEEHKMIFYEVSAKKGINISKMYKELAYELTRKTDEGLIVPYNRQLVSIVLINQRRKPRFGWIADGLCS